jgi:hypothetical protein
LSYWQFEFEYDRRHHQDNDDIGRYVVNGVAVPECTDIDTGTTSTPAMPSSGHWITLKYGGHGEAHASPKHEDHESVAGPSEPDVFGENPKIKVKYGQFREVDGEFVKDL